MTLLYHRLSKLPPEGHSHRQPRTPREYRRHCNSKILRRDRRSVRFYNYMTCCRIRTKAKLGMGIAIKLEPAYALLALTSFAVGGCVSWPPGGSRTQLTDRAHYSGWASEIRNAAVHAYPYAQIAANAYGDGRYDLGPDFRLVESQDNDEIGFAYSVYERGPPGAPTEVILAFRGTEFTKLSDWYYGNVLRLQNPRGVEVFDRIRAKVGRDVPIFVVGHSLGGGIAIQVSLLRPNAPAIVFNTSPRFRAKGPVATNPRISIVEYGEVLKAVRVLGREPTQTYISIGCKRGLNVVAQHSMAPLSDCLTRIASYDDASARASLTRNRISPPTPIWIE